ncbi:MAG: hemolysin family protein [Acidobacteria bacterium]|nr:hemolysin family protein [Acidobacteriota bacterium]MCA1610013.1 hemolysin family protein [Acidobacteriota bacterium]
MMALITAGFCYLAFLLFETFALALDRLSPIRLRGLFEEHPDRARILSGPGEIEITRTTTKVLVQILLLTGLLTVVHAFAGFGLQPPWAWGGAVFLFGWLVTEILLLRWGAKSDPEKIVARLLPTITAASWLLLPVAIPVRRIFGTRERPEVPPATEEEVQAYIDVGREEGILEKEEEKLLLSIVDFGETRVREVMTPRTDMVSIEESESPEALAELFTSTKYSRIPVVRGSTDKVVGSVHVKDLFFTMRHGRLSGIADILREAYFVPESKKVSELLREFQRRHLWMAIVVDEYGGVSGLVTVEDLLEEIVGEIWDEHEDEREAVTPAGERAYSVSGKENIETVRELFGRGPEEEEFSSLGGFLAARLGHIPRPGETHRESDLLFTVEEADRRRVHRVRIEPAVPVAESEVAGPRSGAAS